MVGRYTVVAELGAGGMAAVYRGRFDAGGIARDVALKAIHPHLAKDPRFVNMFLDEAQLAARVSHANVCALLDFGSAHGVPYLVMEYLEGRALVDILRSGSRVPIPVAARIIADAARGLHAAHTLRGADGGELGVVHRDVSPQNIFVTRDGITKVLDFGVAKARGRLSQTGTGEVKGKLAYMSPEQLRGADIDARSDVWGLGVVLWETLLSRRLFAGGSEGETAVRVLQGPIPSPRSVDPSIPEALDRIVMSTVEREVRARCPSAAALAEDLEDFLVSARLRGSPADVSAYLSRVLATNEATDEVEPLTTDSLVSAAALTPPPLPVGRPRQQIAREADGGGRWAWAGRQTVAVFAGLATLGGIAGVLLAGPGGATRSQPPAAVPDVSRDAGGPDVTIDNGALGDAAMPELTDTGSAESRRTEPASPAAPRPPGRITIFAIPSARVRAGAASLGDTPILDHELPSGRIVLELTPSDGAPPYRVRTTVRPGETTVCRPAGPDMLTCAPRGRGAPQ